MSFKKFLVIPLIVATLGIITPAKKAQAGVVILFSTASLFNDAHKPIGYSIGGTLGAATMIGGVLYGLPLYEILPPFGLFMIVGSAVLDINGDLSKDALAAELAEKYNFIDNQAVIENLASKIKSEYELVKVVHKDAYIALNESETRLILEASNLSESEIEHVVNDLK